MERAGEARVSDAAQAGLRVLVLGRNTPRKVVLRPRIVLLTAEGVATAQIVRQVEPDVSHGHTVAQALRQGRHQRAAQGRSAPGAQAAHQRRAGL